MYKKRERTQNWTPEEKRCLLELCEKRLEVIEDKKIDSASSHIKSVTWKYIHENFCERFGPERDVQRLKEQWRRLKGHAKTEMLVEMSQLGSGKCRGWGIGNLSDAIRRSLDVPQVRTRGPVQKSPGNANCNGNFIGNSSANSSANSGGSCEPSTSGCNGNARRSGEHVVNGMLRNALQNGTATCKVDTLAKNAERDAKNFQNHFKGRESDSNTSMSYDDDSDLIIDIEVKEEIREPIIDIDEREIPFDPPVPSTNKKPLFGILAADHDGDSNMGTGRRPTRKSSNDFFALAMFKMRVIEQKRRMQIMEKEHKLRMETLELKRDTKRIKREALMAEHIESGRRAASEPNEPRATSSVRFGSDQLGSMGSGAGKGGGGGGSIREAGGAFGKMEAAREEEFFYKQQREQLLKLKTDLTDEISFHEEQVKRHQEAIKRHTQRVSDIENKTH